MSDSFDPYRVWLGIPPESRPPTHYELLGISPNEHERAVIEAAVLRQSGYVRNFQIGKYAKDAARILNEIAAAKACLLEPAKRAGYDAELKVSQPAIEPQPYQARPPVLLTPAIDIDQFVPTSAPLSGDLLGTSVTSGRPLAATRANRGSARRPLRSKRSDLPWQAMAGFVIGAAFTLVVFALWPRRTELPSSQSGEPLLLTGDVTSDAGLPAPTKPLSQSSSPTGLAAARAQTPLNAPRTEQSRPEVVQVKSQTYSWPFEVARHEGAFFHVGLTGDVGWSALGYELKGARRIVLQVNDIGPMRPVDGNFFAGFLVDYHTSAGYSHRVELCLGRFTDKWRHPVPDWGAHVVASQFVDLTQMFAFNERKYLEDYPDIAAGVTKGTIVSAQEHWQITGRQEGRNALFGTTGVQKLDLKDWAPAGWDGNAWFSVAISNAGAGAHIEGELIEPAQPRSEKLPGEFRRLTAHTDSVTSVEFLPDGRLLSGSFDTTWAVWDVRGGIGMRRWTAPLPDIAPVRAAAVAPDGQAALLSLGDRTVHIELATGKPLKWLLGYMWPVWCLAFHPDGRRAVSGGHDSHVRFWDLETGQQVWEAGLPSLAYSIALSPKGDAVFAGGWSNEGGTIYMFDSSGHQIRSINTELPGGIIGISLSRDGKRFLAGSEYAPIVKLCDLESGAEVARFEIGGGTGTRPVLSPDGRYAAAGNGDGFVSLWDVEQRMKIAEFEHAPLGSPKHRRHALDWMPVAFSPDGKLLASGGDDGTIYLWDVASIVASEAGHDDIVAGDAGADRGQFTPLDLSTVATVVSTQGLFGGKETEMTFDDWSPKEVEGVPFQLIDPQGDRIPNAVMLYGPAGALPPTMPTSMSVACNAPAKAIHFLSGVSGWGAQRVIKGGSVSMIVRLHYADGRSEDHPLRNGEHFADYIGHFDVPKSKLAFILRGKQIRYFAIHPRRGEPIERIELLKGPDPTAPIVMAMTVHGP